MKATAVANANIALVKYWGKRNEELILPCNSSISVTLEGLTTTTSVEFDEKLKKDVFLLNDKEQSGEELERVVFTLDKLRKTAGARTYARVESRNDFPTAAGLASSASGGAALVIAASQALGLQIARKELSIFARMNSGSACRSVEGGFVEWTKGSRDDGSDSHAVQIAPETHWPDFRIIATILSSKQKKIKSRAGMKQSVATCPYYPVWQKTAEEDCKTVREAILKRDLALLGPIAEMSALKMHAVMMTTNPPIIYWTPDTVRVLHTVHEMRDEGMQCYFTMDGGPQVKVICLEKDAAVMQKRLAELEGVENTIICKPGQGATLVR